MLIIIWLELGHIGSGGRCSLNISGLAKSETEELANLRLESEQHTAQIPDDSVLCMVHQRLQFFINNLLSARESEQEIYFFLGK